MTHPPSPTPSDPGTGGGGTTGPGRLCRDCYQATVDTVGPAWRGQREILGPCTHKAGLR